MAIPTNKVSRLAQRVAGLALLFAASGCATRARSLNYIGELSIGAPVMDHRSHEIFASIGFSGGGVRCCGGQDLLDHIGLRVSGHEIEVTLVTEHIGFFIGPIMGRPYLRLDGIRPGAYTVYYRDPDGTRHRLASINVPK